MNLSKVSYHQRFKSAEQRFRERFNKNGPIPQHRPELGTCWIWLAGKIKSGYGVLHVDGKATKAHRFSYVLHFGCLNATELVCHHCDNPSCVNPNHLFKGTHQNNKDDRINKGRLNPLRGETHKFAKLNSVQVLEIRSSALPPKVIAREYGVTPGLVWAIRTRRVWKHI